MPSGSVDMAGHWMLKPSGVPTVLMMFKIVCGFSLVEIGTVTPDTLSDPMLKVPVEAVDAPEVWVATHCSPPS